eukprot:scaffold537422_cov45-Prasinocladus_malaysianus.AAC.2
MTPAVQNRPRHHRTKPSVRLGVSVWASMLQNAAHPGEPRTPERPSGSLRTTSCYRGTARSLRRRTCAAFASFRRRRLRFQRCTSTMMG